MLISARRRAASCVSSGSAPRRRASSAMRRDTVDLGRRTRSAARLNDPASTTRANSSRSLGSTLIGDPPCYALRNSPWERPGGSWQTSFVPLAEQCYPVQRLLGRVLDQYS